MRIAIASGKGGTGKTFVSVNLFQTFQKLGVKCILADCDTEVPNALAYFTKELADEQTITEYRPQIDPSQCLFCGKCADYCAYHAIFILKESHYIRLLNDLCHGCGACRVACPSGAIIDGETIAGKVTWYRHNQELSLLEGRMQPGHASSVPLVKAVTSASYPPSVNHVIYDSPPGTSCPFIQTVSKADYVILVTEPTPFGLSDLRQAIETLQELKKPFGVIVNRAGLGDTQVYQYLDAHHFELLSEIPFDETIAKLYADGEMVVDRHQPTYNRFMALANKLETIWK